MLFSDLVTPYLFLFSMIMHIFRIFDNKIEFYNNKNPHLLQTFNMW